MVLSGSIMARSQSSLKNNTNVCGGPNKTGLARGIGSVKQSNHILSRLISVAPTVCENGSVYRRPNNHGMRMMG
jgi:hypothetical protein